MTKDGVAGARLSTISRPAAGTWSLRESAPALPLAGAHATWDCCIASVRSIAAERIVFLFPRVFHPARPSTIMTDDNRTRPPSGATRAGYAPRYQPRSLVPSRTAQSARSARSAPRTGGGGKKEIFCAIGVDVDAVAGWLGSYGGENSPCDISRGLFAGEIGVPRLVKLFDRLGIRTSWFIPGHSIDTFPTQCKMVVDAGHEIGMHGYSHENPIAMTPEQEEAVMDRCIELIERISGRRPSGYVAPWWEFSTVTNELLLRKGIKYDHSLMNDDFHPFYVRVGDSWTPIDYSKHPNEWMRPLVRGEETDLIDIPGSWYLDDLPPMMFIKSAPNSHGFIKPRDIEELWCDQFDWVYREYDYAVFAMTIHPDVSGRPQVLLMLERMYDYISKHAGVKFCTFDEIADDFRRRCPRESAPAAAAARAR
jgi:peptidoglycan/xylan/chitin deacetylase (PgdA/CDA1 family)